MQAFVQKIIINITLKETKYPHFLKEITNYNGGLYPIIMNDFTTN